MYAKQAAVIDPSLPFEEIDAQDRRQLVIDNTPRGIAAFALLLSVVAVAEWYSRPTHRDAMLIVGSLYALIAAIHLTILQVRPAWAVGSAVASLSASCAAMLSYSPMVAGNGELCVLAVNVLFGGFAVAFPLGLRNQLIASIVPLIGYPIILQLGTTTAFPFWYSATALLSFLVVLALGASVFDRYRRQILHDAFRQAALAAENAALRDEARKADRAKSDMMAILSHELRAPLGNIRNFSEILLEGELEDSERTSAVSNIFEQASRVLDMIETMLEADRLDTTRITLNVEDFDVTDLLARVRAELPASWQHPGVQITWQAPLPGQRMSTDRGKIEAILRNLIHNALKHTKAGSVSVTATVDAEKHELTVAVTDTGEGMSEENLSHMFERFAQGPSAATGFGLGLFIVKRFVEALGGRVRVDSAPGEGTRFEIVIPSNAPAADQTAPPGDAASSSAVPAAKRPARSVG